MMRLPKRSPTTQWTLKLEKEERERTRAFFIHIVCFYFGNPEWSMSSMAPLLFKISKHFFKFLKVMKRILDVCKISTKKPYI
jgi:hypothetical protein